MKKDTQHKNTAAAKVSRIKQKAAELYPKNVVYCINELIERHWIDSVSLYDETYIENEAGNQVPFREYLTKKKYRELSKQVMSACKQLGINVFALNRYGHTGIYLSHFGNDVLFDYDIISLRRFVIKNKMEFSYDADDFAYKKPRRRHRKHKIPIKNVPTLVKWRLNN